MVTKKCHDCGEWMYEVRQNRKYCDSCKSERGLDKKEESIMKWRKNNKQKYNEMVLRHYHNNKDKWNQRSVSWQRSNKEKYQYHLDKFKEKYGNNKHPHGYRLANKWKILNKDKEVISYHRTKSEASIEKKDLESKYFDDYHIKPLNKREFGKELTKVKRQLKNENDDKN